MASVRTDWRAARVERKIDRELIERMRLATIFLQSVVKKNISIPVAGGRRSKPGEYPRKDTGALRGSVIRDVRSRRPDYTVNGYVGHKKQYGLELEIERDRKLLVESLNEALPTIKSILTAPIAGAMTKP